MLPGPTDRDRAAAEPCRRDLLPAERARIDPIRPTDHRFQPIARQAGPRAATVGLIVAVVALAALTGVRGANGTTAPSAVPAASTAIEKTNAEVARRFFDELHTEGNLAVAEEIVAPDAVFHIPGAVLTGPEGVGGLVTVLRTAFPDAEFPIEDLAVDGDTVVVRWSMTGTSEGEFQGIPPTGEAVEMSGIAYLRIVDGLIVEDWVEYNLFGLLQQLGAIPTATE